MRSGSCTGSRAFVWTYAEIRWPQDLVIRTSVLKSY